MTCKNCGGNLDNNAKFCISCGTPVSSPKKKKKKAPIIITIAVILVLALVAGGVFLAFAGAPTTKVYGALKNTLFESSEYEIEFKFSDDADEGDEDNDWIKAEIKLTLGDDVDSSVFDMTVTEQWESFSYGEYGDLVDSRIKQDEQSLVIKNSKIYFDGEQEGTLEEYYDEIEEELEYYTEKNIDVEKELNNLINGKIDEKSLETLYNETIKPVLEDLIKEETDESVELPEYKDVLGKSGTLSDLFKNKDVQEAIELEKIKSDLPGTTYEYYLDIQDLAEAVLDYAMEDKQYREYLETIADYCDYDDVDELVDEIVEEFDYYDNIEGTITIKSNRITHLTIDFDEGAYINISIKSK